MPVKLFSLRGVPDDEADEIRAVLAQHAIDYYETPPGNWGVSMPAIWLPDDSEFARAQALLDEYQQLRAAQARAAYTQLKAQGKHRTVLDTLRENPIRFLVYLSAAAALFYLSTKPFLGLGS